MTPNNQPATYTTRDSRDNKVYLYAITQNHLDGIKADSEYIKRIKKNGLTRMFKLYDDDDNLYYTGYYNDTIDDLEEHIYSKAYRDSGCTIMEIKSKKTKKMICIFS